MNVNCKRVIEDFGLHRNPDLTQREKAEYKQHLIECETCQAEYEGMLHAAAVLEDLADPVPPRDLAERIQGRIHQRRQRSVLNFLANPIARILVGLKLGPHPTFVNYAALLFYLMLTVFLVKLTFFNSPDSSPVATVKSPTPQIRIITVGQVKKAAVQQLRIEEKQPNDVPIELR